MSNNQSSVARIKATTALPGDLVQPMSKEALDVYLKVLAERGLCLVEDNKYRAGFFMVADVRDWPY